MNYGIILANGTGTRFGTIIPKQFNILNGKEVIDYSIEALNQCNMIDFILVVIDNKYKDKVKSRYPDLTYLSGGDTRNKSLFAALKYINEKSNCDKVVILEAARPMVTTKLIDEYISKLDEYDSVITGQKITDSLGMYREHIVNRDDYYLIQAPEAFKFKMLFQNFNPESKITATNQQMPDGSKLYINFDFKHNIKITYYDDLELCENKMRYNHD